MEEDTSCSSRATSRCWGAPKKEQEEVTSRRNRVEEAGRRWQERRPRVSSEPGGLGGEVPPALWKRVEGCCMSLLPS